MTGLMLSTTEGLLFPIALDGELLYQGDNSEIFPSGLSVDPVPIQDHVDTLDGGAQTFQPMAGSGHANFASRYIFRIPYPSLAGPIRRQLERARKQGVVHTFAIFKPEFEFYSAPGDTATFYLPRQRRNAGTALAGLTFRGYAVDTSTFPMTVKVAGVAQTIAYQVGPTLTVPASGTVNVSREPDATGHVPFRFAAPVAQGVMIEIEYTPVFQVTVSSASQSFGAGMQEQHSIELQER